MPAFAKIFGPVDDQCLVTILENDDDMLEVKFLSKINSTLVRTAEWSFASKDTEVARAAIRQHFDDLKEADVLAERDRKRQEILDLLT